MSWPPNPYLDNWLRTPDGQAYLEKYGALENWKRRHLLDPVDMPVVEDAAMEPGTLLFVPTPRPRETTKELAKRSILLTNVDLSDAWDF